MADSPDQKEATADAAGGKKPGLMTLVKAAVAISVLVGIQMAAASMLLPSEAETKEIAEKLATAAAAQDHEHMEESGEEEDTGTLAMEDMREVPLGSYHVQTFNQDSGTSLNVDFELYGTVLADEESEFFGLYESNQVRIREQVLVTIRSAELTDLTDSGLGLIKRKILEKTNRALGKPLLHEAVFSEYSFVER